MRSPLSPVATARAPLRGARDEQAMSDIASRPSEMVDRASAMLSDAGRGVSRCSSPSSSVSPTRRASRMSANRRRSKSSTNFSRGGRRRVRRPTRAFGPGPPRWAGHNTPTTTESRGGGWDLALVHVVQPTLDAWWLSGASLVLDPGDQLRTLRGSPRPSRANSRVRRGRIRGADRGVLAERRPRPSRATTDRNSRPVADRLGSPGLQLRP